MQRSKIRFKRSPVMERGDLEPDDVPRAQHACWAMPGAVAVIVLMILAFASQFSDSVVRKDARPGSMILANSTEAGGAARAAVAASRHQ